MESIQGPLRTRLQKSWPSFLTSGMAARMDLALVPPLHRPLRPEGSPDPLRDRLAQHVERSVLDMLDPDRIEALAEDMRIIERKRVHHAGLLVCALVLSAFERSTDTAGRLLDARITYTLLGGPESGKTSFRKMAHKLLPVQRKLLKRQLRRLADEAGSSELGGRLSTLADVLIPDGCAFKLARALSGVYSGTGTDAELKIHAVYSVKAGACVKEHRTAGSVHDSDGFWPATWMSGALYLWDLGYQNNERFIEATKAGAYVLQRLKDRANPVVLASYGETGARRALAHEDGTPVRLDEACEAGLVHHKPVLDLDIEIAAQRQTVVARVVCVPHQGDDFYYLTTLPREVFSAHDIAELYRMRWEVELLFRNWKGAMRLDEVRRLSHPQSLDVAVTSSLLAAVLGRDIHTGLEHLAQKEAAQRAVAATAAFSPGARANANAIRRQPATWAQL